MRENVPINGFRGAKFKDPSQMTDAPGRKIVF
jgi:hypothetical protein